MRRFCTLTATALVLALGVADASAMTVLEKSELSSSVGGLIAAQKVCGLNYDSASMHKFLAKNVPAEDHDFMHRAIVHSAYLARQSDKWPVTLKNLFCSDNMKVARQYGL